MQAVCARDARAWFAAGAVEGVSGVTRSYRNHFNAKRNACYAMLDTTLLYASHGKTEETVLHSLFDVNENRVVGVLQEGGDCKFDGKPCQSQREFDELVAPYMHD